MKPVAARSSLPYGDPPSALPRRGADREFGPWWSFSGGSFFGRSAKAILEAVRATAVAGVHPARVVRDLPGRPPAVVLDWGTSAARFEVRQKGQLDVFELSAPRGARRPLRSARIVQEVNRVEAKLEGGGVP